MEAAVTDVPEPLEDAMCGEADLCDACGDLTLDDFVKSPSVSLRGNHSGLERKEWLVALAANPPLTPKISHFRSNKARCSLCRLIIRQLGSQATPQDKYLQIYRCEDLKGGVGKLWFYVPRSKEPALKLTLFADEGMRYSS